MLTNIPAGISRITSNIVKHHPNTFSIQAFRRTLTRSAESEMGGLPTIGGMGVLSSADEEQFEYEFLGNGYALPAEVFTPSSMVDHRDAPLGDDVIEFRFLIEPEEPSGHSEHFIPKKHDVFYLFLGDPESGARLAFEIVDVEATLSIPPYAQRYVTNRRDYLNIPAGAAI